MRSFAAESPREVLEMVEIDLSKEQGHDIEMRIRIPERKLDVNVRLASRTAEEIGHALLKMACP